ncbi:hypothetical protein Tco_0253203, partial [Tanacetum coccineum]
MPHSLRDSDASMALAHAPVYGEPREHHTVTNDMPCVILVSSLGCPPSDHPQQCGKVTGPNDHFRDGPSRHFNVAFTNPWCEIASLATR